MIDLFYLLTIFVFFMTLKKFKIRVPLPKGTQTENKKVFRDAEKEIGNQRNC